MKYKNLPIFLIYRASEIVDLYDMRKVWRLWANQASFAGFHFIQINGREWGPNAWELQHGMDSIAEFYPNFYQSTGGGWQRGTR
jgi:hypothetical protein